MCTCVKDFEEFKRDKSNNRANILLSLIMEEGTECFRSFCAILLQDERMKVPMLKMMNNSETGKNTNHHISLS